MMERRESAAGGLGCGSPVATSHREAVRSTDRAGRRDHTSKREKYIFLHCLLPQLRERKYDTEKMKEKILWRTGCRFSGASSLEKSGQFSLDVFENLAIR